MIWVALFFDTAEGYGNGSNEELVGEALKKVEVSKGKNGD
jgi:aryl-alcohol dehydrogenase-like predicted oxidoreductase